MRLSKYSSVRDHVESLRIIFKMEYAERRSSRRPNIFTSTFWFKKLNVTFKATPIRGLFETLKVSSKRGDAKDFHCGFKCFYLQSNWVRERT